MHVFPLTLIAIFIGINHYTELQLTLTQEGFTRKRACEQLQRFGEHVKQASTRLYFVSKSSKGKVLRAVTKFHGPFITPSTAQTPGFLSVSASIY